MEFYSECCNAPPEGEVDEAGTHPIGFCSQCKDHTVFYWDLPFEGVAVYEEEDVE